MGITEDKKGFIWVGTSYGLNRLDGHKVKTYLHKPGDSTSLASNFVRSLYGDSKGRIWVGSDPGFCHFDYGRAAFVRYSGAEINILDIVEDLEGNIWVGTSSGLKIVDTLHHRLVDWKIKDQELDEFIHTPIRDLHYGHDDRFYMATAKGIIIIDRLTQAYEIIKYDERKPSLIGSNDAWAVLLDRQNRIWVSTQSSHATLYCIQRDKKSAETYTYFHSQEGAFLPNTIHALTEDDHGRIWIGSLYLGLSLFHEANKSFTSYFYDPVVPNSFSSNHCTRIFQDSQGIIWLSAESANLSYFHPDQVMFHSVKRNKYKELTLPDNFGRAATEDLDGNYWLGTSKGIAILNPQLDVIRTITNADFNHPKLHSESIRSLLTAVDGSIWIGTSKGVNRYFPETGKMLYYDTSHHLPLGFTPMIKQLRDGQILIGNQFGLFAFLPAQNIFYSYADHPVLGQHLSGMKTLMEDQHGNWWIATFNRGLIHYDPHHERIITILHADSTKALSNEFVQSVCEDHQGMIWIGTRDQLTRYNPKTKQSLFYGQEQGLQNPWICGIQEDTLGRLWIGTANGLYVLDSTRQRFQVFNEEDGLLSNQFNEQDVTQSKEGVFIYPTFQGFVFFRPEKFHWQYPQPPVYLTDFSVLNTTKLLPGSLEETNEITLRPSENFFTIEMTGLHYLNPERCVYAYLLEGFDKEWQYTTDNNVNYTNVPGGQYTFRYKVSVDPGQWDVQEKALAIDIKTVFYKTKWFQALVLLFILGSLSLFYRYRMNHSRRLMLLQSRTQALEKEKAMVMYENLKEHLNPHFLFNSLSSLSSLIRIDGQHAIRFVDTMSKVYRYILKNRDNETVPLREELQFVQAFIELQKTRFEETLQVRIHIDEEYLDMKIAPVTIQNLIENAIKHNVADIENPLVIEIFIEEGYLIVRNTLRKKSYVETSNQQGLANMVALYRYLSDLPMVIAEEDPYFIVKIPLL